MIDFNTKEGLANLENYYKEGVISFERIIELSDKALIEDLKNKDFLFKTSIDHPRLYTSMGFVLFFMMLYIVADVSSHFSGVEYKLKPFDQSVYNINTDWWGMRVRSKHRAMWRIPHDGSKYDWCYDAGGGEYYSVFEDLN